MIMIIIIFDYAFCKIAFFSSVGSTIKQIDLIWN